LDFKFQIGARKDRIIDLTIIKFY